MNQRNCLDQNIILLILDYLGWKDLNNLAGLVLSSDSKEIKEEFYNQPVLNNYNFGERLMIYSWHDKFWKDFIEKKAQAIKKALWNSNYFIVDLKKIRGNYRLMFIKEIRKSINWDEVQYKRDRMAYINSINTRITVCHDNYSKSGRVTCMVDGIEIESEFICELWDTAGHEENDRLRPLVYGDTKLFILEYAIDRMSSLKYLVEHLMWECSQCAPDATFVVVSTKNDISSTSYGRNTTRDKFSLYWNSLFHENTQEELISREEGIKFAKSIGAVAFIETSSKEGQGTKDLEVKLAIIRHLHLKY